MTRPGPFDADLTARTQRPAHKETTMGTDGLREQLAEALDAADNWNPDPTLTGIEFWDHYADALLPVVESYAAQKAAEELEAAAEELHVLRFNADANPQTRWPSGSPRVAPDSFYRGIVLARLSLRARAAALTPATEEKR